MGTPWTFYWMTHSRMLEIFRTRDNVVFVKGAAYTVKASSALLSAGWPGGQGLMWANGGAEFTTTFADGGRGAGFALWGSDEESDQFTSMTASEVAVGHLVIGSGSWIISTLSFEIYTYASRVTPPLVPITYLPGQKLFWSLRGLWTNEDEWTLSGDPRAPNVDPVGFVAQPPSNITDDYLTIQTTL